MYLVDTNILIVGIAQKNPEYNFLQRIIKEDKLILSVISISEYLSQATVTEEAEIGSLIDRFPILSVDLKVAKLAAEYRKKFLKTKRIQLLDYFLAAQAKLHDLTLVTNNKADFPMKDIKVISP